MYLAPRDRIAQFFYLQALHMQAGPSQQSDVAAARRRSRVVGKAPATATAAQGSARRKSVQAWLGKSAALDDTDEEMIDELLDQTEDDRDDVESEASDDDQVDRDMGDDDNDYNDDDNDDDNDDNDDDRQGDASKSSTPQRITRSAAKGKAVARPKKLRSSASTAQRRKASTGSRKASPRKAGARKGKAVAGAQLAQVKVIVSDRPLLPMF